MIVLGPLKYVRQWKKGLNCQESEESEEMTKKRLKYAIPVYGSIRVVAAAVRQYAFPSTAGVVVAGI